MSRASNSWIEFQKAHKGEYTRAELSAAYKKNNKQNKYKSPNKYNSKYNSRYNKKYEEEEAEITAPAPRYNSRSRSNLVHA
jgi:hypothetical protein